MFDERDKIRKEDTEDIIEVNGELIDDTVHVSEKEIGTIDEIIKSVRYDDISTTIADIVSDDKEITTNKVNSLDAALRAVDKSGLSPAPVSGRSLSTRPENRISVAPKATDDKKISKNSLFSKGVDKYGLPIEDSADSDIMPISTREITTQNKSSMPAAKPIFLGVTDLVSTKDSKAVSPSKNEDDDTGSTDFKVNFDFDSAYKDPPENRPLRRRRERRTGLVGGLLYAVFILCIGLVLASVMWMATIDVLGFSSPNETVDVVVPDNFTMDGVTDILYEAGLIRYKALFALFADYSNAEDKISPGAYVLNRNYDYRALVQGMTARAGVRVEITVTIPEGYTLAQIFTLLEAEEVCSADELWETATNHDFNYYFLDKETLGDRLRLEGFLFPDTYDFYKNSTAVRAINRMLREFDNKYTEQYVERADTLGYTIREIITIASMIEREAGNDEERSRISAVIYNRLNSPSNFPNLEIDATIRYAIAGTSIPFSTLVESEYNTYLHPGLPPGPIANPGLASIQAALYPLSTNEYFYALHLDGSHRFFRNAGDHQAFVNSDEYGG